MEQPLWKLLRPRRIEDFIGYESELQKLTNLQSGGVLFYGQMGCGKTSAALAVAAKVVGSGVLDEEHSVIWDPPRVWASYVDVTLNARGVLDLLKQKTPLFGRWIHVVDEAQELEHKQQQGLAGFLDRQHSGVVCICTSEVAKIHPRLQQRCTHVALGPLTTEGNRQLIQRGWRARGMQGAPPMEALLDAFLEQSGGFDYTDPSAKLPSPRDVLRAVDEICNGQTVGAAVAAVADKGQG